MERETERDQMERYREMKRYREMAPSSPPSPGPDITTAESNTNTDFHNNSSQFKVKLGLGLGLGILGLLVIALIYYLYIKNKTQAAQQAATELQMVQRTLTQRVFVDSFPVSVYSLPEEGIDTDECSICCTEFEGGSSLMLLPFCRHVFHRGCMASYWAHLTRERPCPICRHDYETWQPDLS